MGVYGFFNTANSSVAQGNSGTEKFIAGMGARVVTSDSNAGDDSGGYLEFYTKPEAGDSSVALTLGSENNATFAGAVEINGIGTWNTPSGGVAFNVDAFTDGFGVIRFRTNGNASKWDVGMNNSNHFYIGNNGVNTALEIEEVSSNATFAGIVGMGSTGIYAGTNAQLNLPGRGIAFKNDKNGSNNNWSYIYNTGTASQANLDFVTGQGTALTLNHDKSATFTGTVNITAGTTGSVGGGHAGIVMTNKFDNPDNSFSIKPQISGVANTGLEIRDETDNASRLVIDGSGNVGIGTTSIPNPFSGAYNNILQVGTTSGHTRLLQVTINLVI